MLFALALVLRRPAAGAWVAIPVLAVWGVVMIAIWAYLLGLSGLAEGSYSIVEVVLTIVIAACSSWGIRKGLHAGRQLPLLGRTIAGLGGFGLQAAFLAASFRLVA